MKTNKTFVVLIILMCATFLAYEKYTNSYNYIVKNANKNLKNINQLSISEKVNIILKLRQIDWDRLYENKNIIFAYDPYYYYISAMNDVRNYQISCYGKQDEKICLDLIKAHDRHLNSAMRNIDLIKSTSLDDYNRVVIENKKRPPFSKYETIGTDDLSVLPQGFFSYAPIKGWTFISPPIDAKIGREMQQ